ncbi:MAG: hypothetical protein ACXW20_15360 [Burkholderiales bacterium]
MARHDQSSIAGRPAAPRRQRGTYFATARGFKTERTFYGSTLRGHVMPRSRSIDIDEPVDLELARALAQKPPS